MADDEADLPADQTHHVVLGEGPALTLVPKGGLAWTDFNDHDFPFLTCPRLNAAGFGVWGKPGL